VRRAALLAAVLVLASAAPARAATISMSGSSVAQAVLADLAYFYGREHPQRFAFVAGGSGTGIADAYRGVVSAGMVSRNLGPSDPPGLVLSPFALSGVCLVTNVSNPVPGLTRAQVQDIVAGRVTSWSQVPGSTRTDAIVPVALDPSGGAPQVFESVFVDINTPVLWQPRIFAAAAQVRDFVESTPAAFGYSDLAFATRLHTLSYDGVPCTRATIATGAYPAQRPLGIVTKGPPRGAVKRFVDWIHRSRKARQVIATRYLPMS
jgi:phosphate transport system substrate-binding protein